MATTEMNISFVPTVRIREIVFRTMTKGDGESAGSSGKCASELGMDGRN